MLGANVIKTFIFIIDAVTKKADVFCPRYVFQASSTFAGKAGAYLSGSQMVLYSVGILLTLHSKNTIPQNLSRDKHLTCLQ
jgi:hypothetical protein